MKKIFLVMLASFAVNIFSAAEITEADIQKLTSFKMEKSTIDELILPFQDLMGKLREKYPEYDILQIIGSVHVLISMGVSNLIVLPLDLVLLIPIPHMTIPAVISNHFCASAAGICASTVITSANLLTFGTGLALFNKVNQFLTDKLGVRTQKESEFVQAANVAKHEEQNSEFYITHCNSKYIFNKYVILLFYKDILRRYKNTKLIFSDDQGHSRDVYIKIFDFLDHGQDSLNCLLVNKFWFNTLAKEQGANLYFENEFLIKHMKQLSKPDLNQLVKEIEDRPELHMLLRNLVSIKTKMPKNWRRF